MKTIEIKTLFIAVLLLTAVRSLPAEMEQARKNFFEAANKGDVAGIKAAQAKGANVSVADGYRLLVPAAKNGHLELIKFLVDVLPDSKVYPKGRKFKGLALDRAAGEGHSDIVKFLVKNGANVNALAEMEQARKNLFDAVERGDVAGVKVARARGANVSVADGYRLLVPAAEKGHLELTKFLVDVLPDFKVCPRGRKFKNEALDRASWNGHLEVVKFLIESGAVADENARGKALGTAAWNGHLEVVKFLVENRVVTDMRAGNEVLHQALHHGHLEVVKFLIESGAVADENASREGLETAARFGHLEIAKFLVEKGANVNGCSWCGTTALMYAAMLGRFKVVEFLIKKDANVNVQGKDGMTALMKAIWNYHLEIVKFLIEKEADVDVQDERGWTALMYAAENGKNSKNPRFQQESRNIMNLLLAAGANPLLKAKDGTTVLEQGNGETVKKCMRKTISRILVEEVASELSLAFPKDLADLIAGLIC